MRKSAWQVFAGILALVFSASVYAAFTLGNILAGVGSGKIKEFTPTGTLVATYDTTTGSNETTGLCRDGAGNVYATMWTAGKISKFDPNGNLTNAALISGLSNPESCQINQAGDLFVGLTGGGIKRFNATTGALLNTYTTNPSPAGWIDIAADQCTIFYGDDSSTVSRFNICTNTQLPTFATMSSVVSGLRALANGDVLASDRSSVSRFNSAGTLLGNYNAPAGNSLIFAVTLDPDNTTFWTADLTTGNIFRYNLSPINSTPVTTFNSGQFVDTAGILVIGEITQGGPGPGPPPPPPPPAPPLVVPTMSEWMLALLAILIGGLAIGRVRRRAPR
jgi:sugar lactone lactonase YvrE